MSAVTGIITLLVVVTLSLLITRIAAVALTFTGLSRDLANFQARSAFTTCGFTTNEAESLVSHPVRRRIVMFLMLLGNGSVVMAISSLIPVFMSADTSMVNLIARIGWLAAGIGVLSWFACSKWVDRWLSAGITWALKRFTRLESYDYTGLLHLSEGYTVAESKVEEGEWVQGRPLSALRLPDEGIQVLGIHRIDGSYVGAPTGNTYVRRGDTLVLYGQVPHLAELEHRLAGPEGDEAHARRVAEQATLLAEQEQQDRHKPRNNTAPSPAS